MPLALEGTTHPQLSSQSWFELFAPNDQLMLTEEWCRPGVTGKGHRPSTMTGLLSLLLCFKDSSLSGIKQKAVSNYMQNMVGRALNEWWVKLRFKNNFNKCLFRAELITKKAENMATTVTVLLHFLICDQNGGTGYAQLFIDLVYNLNQGWRKYHIRFFGHEQWKWILVNLKKVEGNLNVVDL